MAQNDIYNSEGKYRRFKETLHTLTQPPTKGDKTRKYHCINPDNLQWYEKLIAYFEAKDLSFVRRIRLLMTLKVITAATSKNLNDCDRQDVDAIVTFMHTSYKSTKSKRDFIRDIKLIWKLLMPDLDERGRPDETVFPYVVRHLSAKIDKSAEVKRRDRIDWDEYESLLKYFESDRRMQAYVALSFESLARPQEMLYLKIGDVEANDSFASISVSEHGKEGTKMLECIDSWPFVQRWIKEHPLKHDKKAYLFPTFNRSEYGGQMRVESITKKLKIACKHLKIDKPLTAYSLKRNGITYRRIRGDSDMEIQHAAGWTTSKQLAVYDKSTQSDSFKRQLVKRGLIKDDTLKNLQPREKECLFCNVRQPFTSEYCDGCKRPLDRQKIREAVEVAEHERTHQERIKALSDKWPQIEKLLNGLS